ncbi:MAG: 4-alpha-glucanotransferase [Ignavibacteriae bacterium]|nr:MAG: 4-alpha-glucanotransferase [Ignavibacteriota bacterium]
MNYENFLNTPSQEQWSNTGTQKRAGVCVPLFSIYSDSSIGIGEISDLKHVIEWCKKTGMTILQLLPINDMGYDFAPYSAESTFALDPVYLTISKLKNADIKNYKDALKALRKKYNTSHRKVNYAVKRDKLEILWKIYNKNRDENEKLNKFILENSYWLRDYAIYKVLRENHRPIGWENWKSDEKNRSADALRKVEKVNKNKINFHYWLQWQLSEQMKEIKAYASKHRICLMGDLPFLVARESADVWANQNFFKLELASGAPPDMYFALGQKWGMPPYNWMNIAADNFKYLNQRLKYAENFYDMYRIDHFVGLFRVWTVDVNAPEELAAMHGKFDPDNEAIWEEHGKTIINTMLSSTKMLPCGEDLGTVPVCSYTTLSEYGIPGIEFQRYSKENYDFKTPDNYRVNSAAVISTHDSSFFINWWNYETGTIDAKLFEMLCRKHMLPGTVYNELLMSLFDLDNLQQGRLKWKEDLNDEGILWHKLPVFDHDKWQFMNLYKDSYNEKNKYLRYLYGDKPAMFNSPRELIKRNLERISESSSVFSIQLIQEYLYLDKPLFNKMNHPDYRINIPGSVDKSNWSFRLPCSVEEMLDLKINPVIKEIAEHSGRIKMIERQEVKVD